MLRLLSIVVLLSGCMSDPYKRVVVRDSWPKTYKCDNGKVVVLYAPTREPICGDFRGMMP